MSSDEENEDVPTWKGVPATMICINTFGSTIDAAQVAHAATCNMIRQYLREASSQLIGVCLYGTEGSNTSVFGIKSVEEVFPLSLPNLNNYKKLQSINIPSLKQAKELILSDVLWYCNKAFASCNKQLSTRKIIILSRFDTPPSKSDERPTFKRVDDLVMAYIQIKLINVSETDYEINPFYKDFLKEVNREEVDLPKPVWDQKEIKQLMCEEAHRHLAVARISFEIGEGLALGVGIYSLLKSSIQQKKSDLHRDTNAILVGVNKTMKVKIDNDDGMDVDEEEQEPKSVPLLKSETLNYQTYGEEMVEFTDNELKLLKNPFGPPMLKLLGFKPASIICKEKWFIKPGYFLFPIENVIEGSTVAFKAFHQACVEMNKVAICVLCTRVNSKPCIVALSPTTKPLGLNVETGFDVIRLPFVEHVRNIPMYEDDEEVQITTENKSVMKDILKTLCFDYKADLFENPKLQSQYRAIEAIALEEDDVEPFVDTTKPSPDKFRIIKDDLFQQMFGPFGSVAVKKSSSSREGGPESKKAKVEDIDENLLRKRLDTKKVADYTVRQLQDILRSKDIPSLPALTGLKKKDLVELVYTHWK